MAQITVRIDEKLKDEFRAKCDKNGESMSGELKDHIREQVEGLDSGPLPAEPELSKAYKRLYEIRSDDNRIPVAEAEPELANVLKIPTRTVRRRILTQLDDRGYINVKVGIISLNVELEEPSEEIEASGSPEVPADD